MDLEAPGASGAERLLRSRSACVALAIAEEPHELGRWDVGARRQDVVVVRVQADARAPAAKDPREPLLDSADDVCHVLITRRVLPDETHALSIGARDEDPVGDQRVCVGVQARAVRESAEGPAEPGCPWTKALNLEQAGCLWGRDTRLGGALALPTRELVGEDPEDGRGQVGAARVIDYTKEDFARVAGTFDVVFDAVGKTSKGKCRPALAKGGRFVSVRGTAKLLPGDLEALRALVEAGKLTSVIDRRYPLEQIVEAHRYVEAGHKKGNVVVLMS